MATGKPTWQIAGHFRDYFSPNPRSARNGMDFAFLAPRHVDQIKKPEERGEQIMSMGNRAIWAGLWVIGIPLPILVILYLVTGGGCNAG